MLSVLRYDATRDSTISRDESMRKVTRPQPFEEGQTVTFIASVLPSVESIFSSKKVDRAVHHDND